MIEGKAEITISGRPFRLEGGEAILLPANQPHAVTALSPFKMLLTMIRS
jgi:quercetin dioxygenase-like cupin family protein